jgi:FtsP/CotA-like multicopper oxidase with cupredoxin domain
MLGKVLASFEELRPFRRGLWVPLCLSWLACGPNDRSAPSTRVQPAGWDDDIRIAPAEDRNPDPDVVEINLEAKPANLSVVPGGSSPAWTYDGRLPGPLIHAKVGDRVIVHFKNSLPEDTTIHWHGLRVPAAMDGMPGHSQPPVPPNGTFEYEFVVPDASTFWYHPHFDSAAQVGNGLYGPFIVDDPSEPPELGDQVVLVLSDISVKDDGSFEPTDVGGDVGTLFGREGAIVLVNGKVRPSLKARPGLPQRWRVINAARSRYFQLSLPHHSFLRIGGDGGLLPEPISVDEPVLAPAERADLIVVPQGAPGSDLVVRSIPVDRGWGTTYGRSPDELFVVHLEGEPVDPPEMPPIHRPIDPLPTEGATVVSLKLTESDPGTPFELGINNVAFKDSTPVMARVGETQVFDIENTIEWAHPFHLHGFFFQVLEPAGKLEWKDTVNVPVNGRVRFVVRYDDRPGMWMFHCHILDHAEAGMMGSLMVMEEGR